MDAIWAVIVGQLSGEIDPQVLGAECPVSVSHPSKWGNFEEDDHA